MLRHIVIALILLLLGIRASAQDELISQFYFSPLTLNPAFTGLHNGEFRVSGNYRTQYRDIRGGINKAHVGFDARKGRFGLGGIASNVNKGEFNNINLLGSISASFKVSKKAYNYLSIGVQGGLFQSSLGLVLNNENLSTSTINPDVNAGIMFYNSDIRNTFNPFIGAAGYHLVPSVNPFSEFTLDNFGLIRTIKAFGGTQINLTKYFDVTPAVTYSVSGNNHVINAGAVSHYFLKQADLSVLVGGSYRHNNAIIAIAGLQFGDFTLGWSYDINISQVATFSESNGLEFSLVYIKKRKIKMFRDNICPRME